MVRKKINFTFTNGRSKIIEMTPRQLEGFEENLNNKKPFWKFKDITINIAQVVFYEELEEGLV